MCRAQSVVSGSTLRIGSRHFSQSVFLHVKWPARNLSNVIRDGHLQFRLKIWGDGSSHCRSTVRAFSSIENSAQWKLTATSFLPFSQAGGGFENLLKLHFHDRLFLNVSQKSKWRWNSQWILKRKTTKTKEKNGLVEVFFLCFVLSLGHLLTSTCTQVKEKKRTQVHTDHTERKKRGTKLSKDKIKKKKLPWPGFEPGLLRPQRRVLTTRRSRLSERKGTHFKSRPHQPEPDRSQQLNKKTKRHDGHQ